MVYILQILEILKNLEVTGKLQIIDNTTSPQLSVLETEPNGYLQNQQYNN